MPLTIPDSADAPGLQNLQSNSERIGRTPADWVQPSFFAEQPLEPSASQGSGGNRFSVGGLSFTPAFEQASALHTIDTAIDRAAVSLESGDHANLWVAGGFLSSRALAMNLHCNTFLGRLSIIEAVGPKSMLRNAL